MSAARPSVSPPRHPILVLATALANLYAILFALDAALSGLDETVRLLHGGSVLAPVRNGIAQAALLGSVAMPFLLLFVPQLPRWPFVPAIAFAIWAGVGAPPLGALGWGGLGLALSLAQIAVAAVFFSAVKRGTGRPLLRARGLPVRRHLAWRMAGALAVTFVGLPLALALLALGFFVHAIETGSAHYIRFGAGGIDVQETTLVKDGRRVYLVGMVHMGEKQAYDALFESFPKDALILAEGVSDRENRLKGKFSYVRVARLLGLEQQPVPGAPPPPKDEGDAPPADNPSRGAPEGAVQSDIDISDFAPPTVRFLSSVADIYASASLKEAIARIRVVSRRYSEADIDQVFEDILVKRNRHVLSVFDAHSAAYRTVVLPWGALHMPGLEAGLRARGYEVQSRRMIRLARYSTIVRGLVRR